MKIRLMGLEDELNVAIDGLKKSAEQANYRLEVSRFYPCRGSDEVKRVYIDMYAPIANKTLLKEGR